MGFPSPARDTTGTHQRRREHWRRTCAVWNPASTDTHDTGRPAKARESDDASAADTSPSVGSPERRAVVEHPHFGAAGVEPEHDVNEPIGLHVDAGRNLLDRTRVEVAEPQLEQPIHVGGAVLGWESERRIAKRHHPGAIAPLGAPAGASPFSNDLAERRPAGVEPREPEREHVL